MKNLKELTSSLTKIFRQDSIPYRHFARPELLDILKNIFKFSAVETPFPLHEPTAPRAFSFKSGEIEIENKLYFIEGIVFDGRKVTSIFKSETDIAEKAFDIFIEKVQSLTEEESFSRGNIQLETYETMCVVELDLDYKNLFNNNLLSYFDSKMEHFVDKKIARINPMKFTLEILFEQDSKLIYDDKLSYAPKSITIEPRTGTNPNDRIYFVASPCDSKNHLKLIKELEKILK